MDKIKITTIFDNVSYNDKVSTSWGFSAVIEKGNQKLLFDTGNDGEHFFRNLNELNYNYKDFHQVVISHLHWDHINGLSDLLVVNPDIHVFLPSTHSDKVEKYKSSVKNLTLVNEPVEIIPGLFSMGSLPGVVDEQSVVVKSAQGLVVITGCAHPGLEPILNQVKQVFPDENVYLLMGGFHLLKTEAPQVKGIIEKVKEFNVKYIMPSHCTGEEQIQLIKAEFGETFIAGGAGRVLEIGSI